jgi:hypothetical protein
VTAGDVLLLIYTGLAVLVVVAKLILYVRGS